MGYEILCPKHYMRQENVVEKECGLRSEVNSQLLVVRPWKNYLTSLSSTSSCGKCGNVEELSLSFYRSITLTQCLEKCGHLVCLLWETNIHPYFLIKSLLYLWARILRTTFPSIPHEQDSDLDSEWEAFNVIQKQKIESRSHYCTCKFLDNHMNFRRQQT